jgi:hypothetical protein
MWLTEKELERLTRRKRPSAQAQVLREAGIPYRMVDGRPIVVDKDVSANDTRFQRVRKL